MRNFKEPPKKNLLMAVLPAFNKFSFLAVAFLFPLSLFSQGSNLVPNPGFEEYEKLPCDWLTEGPDDLVKDWERPSTGTPDIISDLVKKDCYAHAHSESPTKLGTEKPHSGHVMGMIAVYGQGGCEFPDYREYFGVRLLQSLVPGNKYYAEMYVSLADHSGYATNNLGLCFFAGKPDQGSDCVFPGQPQVNEKNVIEVTEGWWKVSGSFIAKENYNYLAIGNFFDGDNTKTIKRPGSVLNPYYHYWDHQCALYYIDDVLVREEPMLFITGDTLVPAGSIAQLRASGCKKYKWADTADPGRILGHSDFLQVDVMSRRSFYVYSDCDTGMITVDVTSLAAPVESERTLNGRKVKKQRTVYVTNTELTIELYDRDQQDGDIVSLYLGDSCLISNYTITKRKKSIKIHIDPENPAPVILHAVNEGSVPPNTATVIIRDGKSEAVVILRSDFKSSDSVELIYRPKN